MKTAILSKVNFNNLENFASGTNSIYNTETRYNSSGLPKLVSSCASINAIAYYYHILAGEERINLAGVGII